LIQKLPFQRLVRKIASRRSQENIRFTRECL